MIASDVPPATMTSKPAALALNVTRADVRYETAVMTAKQHFTQSKRPWLLLLKGKMPQPERCDSG